MALWHKLLQLVLPTRCLLCQRIGAHAVCQGCLDGLEPVGAAHCTTCGRRRETSFASPDCANCFGRHLGFERARSLYLYNETARRLLGEFKFRGQLGAGKALVGEFGTLLAGGVPTLYERAALTCTAIVPVPLHRTRIAKRRFNQSEFIARHAAKLLQIPCQPEWLERTRDTPTQIGLSANQRELNVRGAFAVPQQHTAAVRTGAVMLVDDLMTTGSTLGACARALRKAGCKQVYALTLFSTHYGADL